MDSDTRNRSSSFDADELAIKAALRFAEGDPAPDPGEGNGRPSTDKPSLSKSPAARQSPKRNYKGWKPTPQFAREAGEGMIIGLGRRIAEEDPESLLLLQDAEAWVEDAWRIAVDGQRAMGRSDSQIAEPLGITKQRVQQRWPRVT